MYLIIDEKMRKIEKDTLKKMGYKLIEIKKNNKVYEEISSHVDIFVCKIGEKIIVEKSQFNNIRSIFNVEQGYEEIEEKYPYDIKYNVCIIGKKAIHNLKYTDSKIIEELKKQNYELINTTQGYTNCSIAVIDDKSAIVTDKGLNKILQKHNINTLYIEDELDIKLINNQIDAKLDDIYESNNLKKINQEKSDINTYLTKKMKIKADNSNDETLKKLVNERNSLETQLTNNSKYVNADKSGVISYRIDGLEGTLTTGDFSYLNEDFLKDLKVQTGQIIAINNKTNGKIVDNFQCNIACILTSDEAKNSEVGKSIKLRLQSSEEIPAKIVYKAVENNDKTLLVFEINNNVSDLIKYRKTSFDVIWWSNSGLKIPNSSIKYEGNIAYVIRNRSGLKEKIFVKVLRSNEKYSIVENYSYAELKEAGYDTSELKNKKSISVYDQIEN